MNEKLTLARYNGILWAVIGTGLVVAVAASITIAIGAALYALFESDDVPVFVVDDPKQVERAAAHYDFCQPIPVYGSPYQLVRVVTDRLAVRGVPAPLSKRDVGSYGSGEPSYDQACGLFGSDRPSALTNVLVRHADTGKMHLALKENAAVKTFEYPEAPSNINPGLRPSFPPPGTLYWEIAFADNNGDRIIDEHDDIGAHLSDIDGKNLTRVTPKMSRVLEKSYDSGRGVLLLRIVSDTNGDGKLDDADAPSLLEVDVPKRAIVREVLNRRSLQALMRPAEPAR